MGEVLSFLKGNTGRNDDPDPTTGLTSRDRYSISSTWKTLSSGKANLETGMEIFLNLFERQPKLQDLFPFKGVSRDELPKDIRFQAHCVTVMAGLSSIVDNLDKPDVLKQLLMRQGINHVPRKVPRESYEDLKQTLMGIFTKLLNKEEVEAWKKLLDVGFAIILQGVDSVN